MSGSIGGLTASRNRGGAYFRRRVVPTNPNTPHQQGIRSALGALVQSWSTILTDEQREAWKTYAINTPRTDVLGQPLTLTGQQAFIGSNSTKAMALNLELTPPNPGEFATVLDGPTQFNTGSPITAINTFTISDAGDEVVCAASLATPADGDGIVFFFMGRAINPTVRSYRGPYTLAACNAIVDAGDDCSITVDPADATAWLWPRAGDQLPPVGGAFYPLRMVICYDDGRYSQPFETILQLTQLPPPGP